MTIDEVILLINLNIDFDKEFLNRRVVCKNGGYYMPHKELRWESMENAQRLNKDAFINYLDFISRLYDLQRDGR